MRTHTRDGGRRLAWLRVVLVLAVVGAVAAATAGTASSASSAVVVSMDVPSATYLDLAGCASASARGFGTVLPGTDAVTSADCTVTFGSSNSTPSLRIAQSDRRGPAMYRPFDGTLDTTFGAGGVRSYDPSGGLDHFWAAVEFVDGDVLAAGSWRNGARDDSLFVRINADGTPDTTFGPGGVRTLDPTPGVDDEVRDLVPLPDGSALFVTNANHLRHILANGTLDGAFGAVTMPNTISPKRVAVDGSGRIYAGGTTWAFGTGRCGVARFSAAGVLDATWGSGGAASPSVAPQTMICDGMAVAPSGEVYLAAQCDCGTSTADATVLKFTSAGQLDTTFGTGGRLTTEPTGVTNTRLIEAQVLDGNVLYLGGQSEAGAMVQRFSTSGVPDTTFDGDGTVILPTSNGARDIQPVGDGVVVTGDYGGSTVARLTSTGALDTTFSGDGLFDPAVPGDLHENGTLVLGDGRLLLAGGTAGATADLLMLGATPVADWATGSADWSSAASSFGACLRAVGGGAAATWTPNASCVASNGAWWNDVPAAGDLVATAPAFDNAATATMRFGLHAAATQRPGRYVAPITFEVTAP
ncbi:MAG: enzyme repeat protein [Thermoleophilia bacterium]|nr:enzyme repeat protein [Thermoleophilia bacterium]